MPARRHALRVRKRPASALLDAILSAACQPRRLQVMQKLLGSREEVGIEAINQLLLARAPPQPAAPCDASR